jgi:NADH-quinone oxidoreductase subunit C
MLIHWLKLRPTRGIRPVPEERAAPRPAPWRRSTADPSTVPPRVARLTARFGDAVTPVLPVFRGDETAWVRSAVMVEVCRMLRAEEGMDFLIDLCGVHTPDREHAFEVVVHLYGSSHNERLRLKTALREGEPFPSLTGIWMGADWHERETFDLVGIPIAGHPHLTRILLPDDFAGHPLRKDFPLKG